MDGDFSRIQWPPDFNKEIRRRLKFLVKCREDRDLQVAMMAFYRKHPIEFINDLCTTHDPRLKGMKLVPFRLFPKQEQMIIMLKECIETRESALIEKCRDVGASWLCVCFSVWLWLFYPNSSVGWGSRKSEYVDERGNPNALFPKIRQVLEYLPKWMLPAGFNMREHAPYMKIINPQNGATITGDVGDGIGRGGRTTCFFIDEAAHLEHPDLVEAALGDNTDVQIAISSVNGPNNVFYRRRHAGEIWQPGKQIEKGRTRVFIFDWRDHPAKTQEWYDTRRKKAEREGLLHLFAQEVDRDYLAALENVIINAQWTRAAIDAHIKLGFSDDGEKVAGQDVADGGGDKNALAIRHGVILKYADHWGGDAGDAAKIAIPQCIQHSTYELFYDSIGVGAGFKAGINAMKATLPPAMKIKPWNAATSPIKPEERVIKGDAQSPKNEDFFLNLKAQAWWSLRTRFYKTYQAVMHGEKYDPAELISLPSSLPNLEQIITELSQATQDVNGKGKMIVDKKPGSAISPNIADSIVISYFPVRAARSFFDDL